MTSSAKFNEQAWQRYRIKDTKRGAEVGEIKWLCVWQNTFASRKELGLNHFEVRRWRCIHHPLS